MMEIRPMERRDAAAVLEMMRVFYDSPAVFHAAPNAILQRDIDDCIGPCPWLDGFVLEEDGALAGYAMTAKSYSTEYGGLCIWVEDIYILPQYRGRGLGPQFLAFAKDRYPDAVRFRLEVEPENVRAVAAYEKSGYRPLPYLEMTWEREP